MSQLFKIEIVCEDKIVTTLLRYLAGKVVEAVPIPIVNAAMVGGKLTAQTSGGLLDMFVGYLKKTKASDINHADVAVFLEKNGKKTSNRGYLLGKATEAGILKKIGQGTKSRYRVSLK